MQIMNNSGPKTDPWGTPCFRVAVGERKALTEIWNCLSKRYKERAAPEIPPSERRDVSSSSGV